MTSDQSDAVYLTTRKHSQQTDIHARSGIRTRHPSKGAAADLRLRPRGHWDHRFATLLIEISIGATKISTALFTIKAVLWTKQKACSDQTALTVHY